MKSLFLLSNIKQDKKSYAQCGEDLIISFLLNAIGIRKPSYIDIGSYDPFSMNNTALFYLNGCSGINIEPNPILFKNFIRWRKRDTNLNIGIYDEQGEKDYYLMSAPTLSTFSKAEADCFVEEHGLSVVSIKKIKVDTITNILGRYWAGKFPQFLSLDAEGLDLQILRSINYDAAHPIVICVETISYSETGRGKKNDELIEFLESKGYMVYADTYINTIFVKIDRWVR